MSIYESPSAFTSIHESPSVFMSIYESPGAAMSVYASPLYPGMDMTGSTFTSKSGPSASMPVGFIPTHVSPPSTMVMHVSPPSMSTDMPMGFIPTHVSRPSTTVMHVSPPSMSTDMPMGFIPTHVSPSSTTVVHVSPPSMSTDSPTNYPPPRAIPPVYFGSYYPNTSPSMPTEFQFSGAGSYEAQGMLPPLHPVHHREVGTDDLSGSRTGTSLSEPGTAVPKFAYPSLPPTPWSWQEDLPSPSGSNLDGSFAASSDNKETF
ncbi:hypothetical protein HYDPIDRAFT_171152 [Hydnomerulius pinastri MD-312]|uniref:Uncharacterized protein n=1 Tax=Hydnomerulius pinastri MD-312 TaxID=994086 RepID=A0A0C9V0J8_9AGAM|nr:hypothetical protein HYDPIDRAFT_171152 [Hydnomerulius pinastri MD-312]